MNKQKWWIYYLAIAETCGVKGRGYTPKFLEQLVQNLSYIVNMFRNAER